MISVLYYILLSVFTLLYFVPFTLLFFVTVLFDRERVILHRASRLWAMGIFRLCPFWKVKKEGFRNIDRSRPYVIITNHRSMADIPMMYVLPLKFKWVSKREVLRWPLFGWVLRMHGDICIERGSGASARKMMETAKGHLDRGTSVIIFPEGTRSRDGETGRFKEGAFLMAKTCGVGILPVVSQGTGTMTKGWRIRIPHTFTVKVLEPIPAEVVAAADVKTLTSETNAMMRAELEKIKTQNK